MAFVRDILRRVLGPDGEGTRFGRDESPLRTAFFVDDLGPTFTISFAIPLADEFAGGRRAAIVWPQRELERLVARRRGARVLERLAAFRPQTVVFSRYGGPLYAEVLGWAKERGVRTVFHIDDNLFEFPEDFPPAKRRAHLAPEVLRCRETLAREADLVYCSTGPLERYMRERFRPARTFSGIYCPYPGVGRGKALNDSKTIGYMGTVGHVRDLELVLPLVTRFLSDHPDWRFELVGELPGLRWAPLVRGQVVTTPKVGGYRRFREMLDGKDWVAGLAPLRKDGFNECKAATKFVEYTAMGAVALASEFEPYREALAAGAAVPLDDLDAQGLFAALSDRERLGRTHRAARGFCEGRYATALLARQLAAVL